MRELELLRSRIKERIKIDADAMAGGAAADFPAYREMVGRASGLWWALAELEEILKKANAGEGQEWTGSD